VRQIEPVWPLVVEDGQRALLEFGFARAWRVEPRIALLHQLTRGLGDDLLAGSASLVIPFSCVPGVYECRAAWLP